MSSRVERIRVAENRIAEIAVTNIISALNTAIGERDRASICLAGGNTPRATYEALAQATFTDWPKVTVYFGDERCVPPDHADSNYRLARAALLDRTAIAPDAVHRIQAEDPDRAAAAERYARELPEQFDVLILGIGEDCHTASLFPGSPAILETERRVMPVTGPKPPFERITLTPPALRGRLVLVLAAGAGKAVAVSNALERELDLSRYPAQLARDAVWVLDHAAAGKLTGAWRSG